MTPSSIEGDPIMTLDRMSAVPMLASGIAARGVCGKPIALMDTW